MDSSHMLKGVASFIVATLFGVKHFVRYVLMNLKNEGGATMMELFKDYPWIVLVVGFLIFIMKTIHFIMDHVTKTDVENSVSYQGKEKVQFFIFIISIFYVQFFLGQLAVGEREESIALSLVVALLVAFNKTLITVGVLSIVILLVKGYFFLIYDLEYYLTDGSEEWLILKVTKEGRVILKREDTYKILGNIEELYGKSIVQKEVRRINEWRQKKHK